MPRENSLDDSEGRSLTPDMDDFDEGPVSPISPSSIAHSPTYPIPHIVQPTPRLTTSPRPPSRRSILSRVKSQSPNVSKAPNWPGNARVQTPIERFRAAVRKVMALHRGTSYLTGMGRIGAEPGVNPRRASANLLYGHIRQDCVIEVIDYSSVRSSFGRMTNAEFINLLDDPVASEREPWVKVRWINIGGVSWDVIRAVSIKYDLHPLALEDLFHTRSQNRSKADYYTKHLFLRVLCHQLALDDEPAGSSETAAFGSTLADVARTSSPTEFDDPDIEKDAMREEDEGTMYDSGTMSRGGTMKKRRRLIPRLLRAETDLEGGRPSSRVSQSSLGKLMKGAAAKQQKRAKNEVTLDALKQRDTGLRTSADPSLLVHAILDLIVDNALEVIDEYHTKINKFERTILMRPNVKTVRYLHILSGDLILHKRTMEPIRTLIYGLRRYDLDRCQALIDMSDPANANVKVTGFMSHKSKIYLADVFDHMEYILTSLDMFAGIAENLIAYTFNLASYEMNQGMNFESMWSVNLHSDLLFWEIALPLMAVIVPLFMWSDIKALWHYIQKKMTAKEAVKTIKRA
ncbi:hypothetical protein DXG01_002130 [Tephrocybe rancida]|nr:hypothetical protein DXG01_002130 [Tephrocybe rancida]